jgi:nicotinamide-nucleotide amidase
VLQQALKRSDLVIISGGLGPTDDDLTRELVSAATGRELVEEPRVWAELEQWFLRRYGEDYHIPKHNRRQAQFPCGSRILGNGSGTAPGFLLDMGGKKLIALPGVPEELRDMFTREVEPLLPSLGGGRRLVTRNLNFVGIGESKLEELLGDLLATQTNPTLALYASGGKLRVRITARADSPEGASALIAPIEAQIKERAGEYFYGRDDETLEGVIGKQLTMRGLSLAVAESCTGGLISHTLTNVPGSSAYFERAFVVYSNRAKEDELGVPRELLKRYGAVSAEVAQAMAEGVRRQANTDYGVAVTGIAGPGGGTAEKPVGLVYIALASPGDTIVERHLWRGSREEIKHRTMLAALYLLWSQSKC